ncbi:hypothetical protein OSB04_013926 [Centaurea solstitialis]|uniref:Transmembrane protein n=1 Tax=Centaurea solstitialis TaxID=347529 RepID=A0AA38WFG9_9ASTR|nr:hypothetical protein OSB04_013926 [Centaurea solstitialis]
MQIFHTQCYFHYIDSNSNEATGGSNNGILQLERKVHRPLVFVHDVGKLSTFFRGMNDKELFMNIVALGILIITIIVNICIQAAIGYGLAFAMANISLSIFLLLCPFWVAFIVPASRRVLEHQYRELHQSDIKNCYQINFSSTELVHHVKKYWVMAETGNPQFVLACSPFCSASGLICSFGVICSILQFLYQSRYPSFFLDGNSDYRWSINVIQTTQSIGILVGSIAPVLRSITLVNYFNLSYLWSINRINMFRVEKHWTQRLREWKCIHVTSNIPGRHLKKVLNHVKNMILNFCITLQVTLVVVCKAICFVPTCIILLFYCFCHFCISLLKRFGKDSSASDNDLRLEIEEYIGYVLQIEDEAKLTNRTLRNMLRSITKLLHKSEKEQPRNLLKLLERSTGFSGVVEFDNDQVPPLYPDETHNCWSLVAITLTVIALALPNIENSRVKGLLASINEGLQFVRHIEETLNVNSELVKARKTGRRIWTEVEVYYSWLEIDLQNKAFKGKSSEKILRWLGDEAVKIVIEFKRSKKRSVDDSLHKVIAAGSMYRISQTILLHCNEQESWPTDVELFEWISTIVADLFWACFTNLPRVITQKCHHDAIEKRGESIRTAAQLLGKSKRILNILEQRQLPDLDQESMAYIDKWQAIPKSQIPNGCASPTPSSSSNESLIVTIMQISQTILFHCNQQENWPADEELFEWISTIIADLLCACFTNLPRVITLRCHDDAMEKRGESIRTAAQLLGKSKRILSFLEERQLPDSDQESMAYIDKWQTLPKSQIPNGCASLTTSSSSNESLIVTIV